MLKKIALLFLMVATATVVLAQKKQGHNIKVKLSNYDQEQLVLGFHFGEKQYIKDTTTIGTDGYFTFAADTMLPCGIYLLVLLPENNFIQVVIPEDDQDFNLQCDAKQVVETMKVKGSKDNEELYKYLSYLGQRRTEADTLRSQIKGTSEKDSIKISEKLVAIDEDVRKYQKSFIEKNESSLAGKMVMTSMEPEVPEFEGGTPEEIQRKKYYWYRAHYFDNVDLTDVCLLRSPALFPKIDQYVNKVIPQHPDTISKEIDGLLREMSSSPELYKYYLIHFLNFYAKSKIVGMDAVYVHVAQEYYCKGDANWAKKEDVDKICDNAVRLAPILIGKIAPNITVLDREGQPHSLWDVDADYTVLFFWDPDCSHCKKAAPFMVKFAEEYKDQGVKVFNVCTATGDDAEECWKNAEEKGFSDDIFLNYSDPYIRSRYKQLYDVRSTPQIFILDRKHEILMKRISAEQLSTVMKQVMEFQKEKIQKGE